MKAPTPIEPTGWSEAIYPVVAYTLIILAMVGMFRQIKERLIEPERSPADLTAVYDPIDQEACGNGQFLY